MTAEKKTFWSIVSTMLLSVLWVGLPALAIVFIKHETWHFVAWVVWIIWCLFLINSKNLGIVLSAILLAVYLAASPPGLPVAYVLGVVHMFLVGYSFRRYLASED